ncbi:MAG TPA: ABC transporter permease [Dehalococcoidia bacterium]|nr:ABC transporter permease [Dehalococcoidia bacterium]
MQTYIVKRLLLTVPILVLVAILTFVLLRLVPGDVLMAQIGGGGLYSPAKLAQMRHQMGLDEPLLVQLWHWFSSIIHGDFGKSLLTTRPTLTAFLTAARVTLELGALAIVIGLLIAIPIGVLSAVKQDTPIDYLARAIATLGISVPDFWLATAFIVFAGIWFRYAVPFGYISPLDHPLQNLQQMVVPALILGFQYSAITMRLVRATMLEVLRQDYVRTARAKGIAAHSVLVRHALRNALIPVVTVIGTQMGFLLGGTVIVESLFNLPGVGQLTFNAISQRDYAQVQTNMLLLGTIVVLANLITDLSYGIIDPRIRYS